LDYFSDVPAKPPDFDPVVGAQNFAIFVPVHRAICSTKSRGVGHTSARPVTVATAPQRYDPYSTLPLQHSL
jgi:hypothetical protein